MKNPSISARLHRTALALALAMAASGVAANNWGENTVWQFNTQQDKVAKTTTLDQVEKKKAGYYDAIRPIYNYTTYIDRQYNCSVSATTTANTGSNATTATNSSPTVSNAGSTSSSTDANSASNSLPQNGLYGQTTLGVAYPLTSSLVNSQANSGALGSAVSGSNTSAATGPVTAGAGTSTQALNSTQSNSGTLTSSLAGNTACTGPFN